MVDVATKPPKRPRGAEDPKKPSRSGEPINVWVRSELMAGLRQLIDHVRPRTTKTALVEEALEDLLAKYRSHLDAEEG